MKVRIREYIGLILVFFDYVDDRITDRNNVFLD